ncbi:MAG: hypothetical protein ACFBSC_10965 [Microcoleaceae cyanobacterium]
MTQPSIKGNQNINSSYSQLKTAEDYLRLMPSQVLSSFTSEQRGAIQSVLNKALPRPSPKIVDLRFTVDLILSRFYFVLFVGQDRRNRTRNYPTTKMSRLGNVIAATLLLLGMNLLITAFIFLLLYLIKSALGIDLFSGMHLKDVLKTF